jgi:hypothetical protein
MLHYTIYAKIHLKILSINITFNTFQGHFLKKSNGSITSIILEVFLGARVLYTH